MSGDLHIYLFDYLLKTTNNSDKTLNRCFKVTGVSELSTNKLVNKR